MMVDVNSVCSIVAVVVNSSVIASVVKVLSLVEISVVAEP